MALNLDNLPGATPLDADELASLIPKHITTQGELTDITHDSAWKATDANQPIPMEFIVATLPNAAEVAGFLHAY